MTKIIIQKLEDEMEASYLDYAMSVIVARALPDVRDGLKPVHRRILFAMGEMGLRSAAKYRKSATVVGSVLGQYHPHGDSPVYEALTRMAQDFSMRYPLVDGQGNMGSIDGDRPAAMRYTETKLTQLAEEMLADIDKDTVDWRDNFDGTRKEPVVLPAKLPQLLLNGALGIAVGMATNIPPHNLKDLCDAIIKLIDEPEISTSGLVKILKGPDFPTGGIIYDSRAIEEAYIHGRGSVIIRAKVDMETSKSGSTQLIIREIPYGVNKSSLLEHIADLVRNKKIAEIQNIRDESNKEGIRVVIALKKTSIPQKTLAALFHHTELEKAFHFNIIALADGIQPQLFSLKEVLEHFVAHRQKVIERRTRFELKQAQARIHILEGYEKALEMIDDIIQTIKRSESRQQAQDNLVKRFSFTPIQAQAILELRLQNLARLEQAQILEELKKRRIDEKRLKAILEEPHGIRNVLKDEVRQIKQRFGDERRTLINPDPPDKPGDVSNLPEEQVVITLTRQGYIKRINIDQFKSQHRGGTGVTGMATRHEDVVEHFAQLSTHQSLLFFSSLGRVYRLGTHEIPEGSRQARGRALQILLALRPEEEITAMLPLPKRDQLSGWIVMATKKGFVKKTKLDAFVNIRKSGLIAIGLNSQDRLVSAKLTRKDQSILLLSKKGQGIRFKNKEIREMGRSARGVRGIRLKSKDEVVSMLIVDESNLNDHLLLITQLGLGKRTPVKDFRLQRRGGRGLRSLTITNRTGELARGELLSPDKKSIIIISKRAMTIKTRVKSIPVLGRYAQGVRAIRLKPDDTVASFITA